MGDKVVVPEHLRCTDSEGNVKPVFPEIPDVGELFRSYVLENRGKKFPGALLKHPPYSVDWSRLARPEDRWIYKPNQGIARFACSAPSRCLRFASETVGQEAGLNWVLLSHAPQTEPPENYAHSLIRFFHGGIEATSEDGAEGQPMVPVALKKAFRQELARCISFRDTPESGWCDPL